MTLFHRFLLRGTRLFSVVKIVMFYFWVMFFEGVERETLKLSFIHITGPLYGSRLRSASGLPRNRGHGMHSDRVDRINVTNGLV